MLEMIKEILYKQIESERKEYKNKNEGFYIGPSYLTEPLRKIYFKKINESPTNPFDEHSKMGMELASLMHEFIQDKLKAYGVYDEGEVFKRKEYQGIDFLYRTDGIVEVDGEKCVIEIKTIYGGAAQIIKQNGYKQDHIVQLVMYMELEDIKRGELFYFDRGSFHMFPEFVVIKNDDLYSVTMNYICQRIEEIKKLKKDIDVNLLPPARCIEIAMKKYGHDVKFDFQLDSTKYKSYPCVWGQNGMKKCQWFDRCWKENIEKFKKSKYNYYLNGEFKE